MPSNKPQILIRPTTEQMEAIRAACRQADGRSLSSFILSTVLSAIRYSGPVIYDVIPEITTTEPEVSSEEKDYLYKVLREFPNQHSFLLRAKRAGKAYRLMGNREKYEYHKSMSEGSE